MKLNQPIKILVGLGTIWMLLYPLVFVAFILFVPLIPLELEINLSYLFFNVFGMLIILSLPIQIGLMLFYLIHVIKNKTASEVVRIILGIGLFLMPVIAMPVYYFTYIWRDSPPDWAIADTIDGSGIKEKTKPLSSKNRLLLLVVIGMNLCICLMLASIFYTTRNLN